MEGQKFPAYKVEFEDGTNGITMNKFVEGVESEYIKEELPTKNDPSKTYTRIKRPQQDKFVNKWDVEGKTLSMTASYAKNLYLVEPFRTAKFSVILEVICKKAIQKQKTMLTDREKDFIAPAMSYAIDIYLDDWQRARFRKAKGLGETPKIEEELDLIYSIFCNLLKDMLDVNKTL
jgi:hypothetical protein